MNYPPDLIEEQISSIDQAWELLNNKLPKFNKLFEVWQNWYKNKVSDAQVRNVITDALVITYARMAFRNGSLSIDPRSYHSEKHINDLLYRLMAVSQLQESKNVPEYGWSLLSIFMSSHDLHQAHKNNKMGLVGDNEQASFQEVSRLLDRIDTHNVIRQEHKELLKLMIHGSTFGKGEDTIDSIYQGNLVKYLLQNVDYFDEADKQLAYLACDIDTANVAADLLDYAKSSIAIYNEIQNISKGEISALSFFGDQQQQYFFELQKFNSKLGVVAFEKQKSENAPKVQCICDFMNKLDTDKHNEEVVEYYLHQVGSFL